MRRVTQQIFDQGGIGQNNWLMVLLLVVLLVNVGNTIFAVAQIHPMSVQVPVRYTTLTAFDELGSWQTLYVLPVAGWLISLLNVFLAQATYRRSRITSIMLVIAGLSFSLFTTQMIALYTGVTHGAR